MTDLVPLLIIGAGPFGLALAACARKLDIDFTIVGRPMGLWRHNMPAGMLLRSTCDWHLDPLGGHTIRDYLAELGQRPEDVEPLSLQFFVEYADWFQTRQGIEVRQAMVQRLDRVAEPGPTAGSFVATLDDGESITASTVVIAMGAACFPLCPEEIIELIPAGRYHHTRDLVEFSSLEGKRCLIIGGRQSAFEWAALIAEQGADAVHIAYRHDTPSFSPLELSWIDPVLDEMARNPGWFRQMSADERQQFNQRLWAEGRLKLEPWLHGRIDIEPITLWPRSRIIACREQSSGELSVTLQTTDNESNADGSNGSGAHVDDSSGAVNNDIAVDHVVLATGYRVDVAQLPLLGGGNILPEITIEQGFPCLDESFQSTVDGLYFTSIFAARDFGPVFGFTFPAPVSAKILAEALKTRLENQVL